MIEHQIDNHAGYGNVQPKRQRPARDAAVPDEVSSRCPVESHDYQRNNDDGEYCMSYQNGEIHRTDKSLPCKPRSAVIIMISEIRNQEQR